MDSDSKPRQVWETRFVGRGEEEDQGEKGKSNLGKNLTRKKKKGKTLLTKDKKKFRFWLMQPDA
jgi:hypothetical protein